MSNPLEKFKCKHEGTVVEINNGKWVMEEDYLKVVEEKERHLIDLKTMSQICNEQRLEIKEKDEEINRLRNIVENEEETWTLEYTFVNSETGEVKRYEQNGMLKEDAFELIGMDSDNWISHTLTKEERPNKDQQIEGLLLRCESQESEIEDWISSVKHWEGMYRELSQDRRLKLNHSDRRA